MQLFLSFFGRAKVPKVVHFLVQAIADFMVQVCAASFSLFFTLEFLINAIMVFLSFKVKVY